MNEDEKKAKLIIPIDISDWRDETYRAEEPITSRDDVYMALEKGKSTGEVAKATIVSRALEIAPEDIIRPDKILLYTGAMADVSTIARSKRHEVAVENGNIYEVAELIGNPGHREQGEEIDTDPGQSYVRMEDPQAVDYAMRYLLKVIPGHVWNKLITLHGCGEDVEKAAGELIEIINAMVRKITEPGEPQE